MRLVQYVAAKWEYGDKKGTLKGIIKGWCSCLASQCGESSKICGQGGQRGPEGPVFDGPPHLVVAVASLCPHVPHVSSPVSHVGKPI